MKRIVTLCISICTLMTGFAQTDSTKTAPDTIKVGSMTIIREKGSQPEKESKHRNPYIPHRHNDRPSNISTNWWIFDFGFSNYNDQTKITDPGTIAFAGSAYLGNPDWPKLLSGKSRNINIWIFMQRLNMVKHVLNLKYGLGVELNNYFYDDVRVRFERNPTKVILDPTLETAKKNKLAADYVTVPLMLNFNFTPHKRQRILGFSAGVSAGYLYSARQKTKQDGHVSKTHSDYDLERWKISYVGEILLGPVKFYGSYAFKNMWEKGLDQTPYTVGFRLSTW
ncbi:MAG TPA: outer membrane beta-barrel protein [Chitinophagaceae bacterium]|nr:outer membrane beta-barrel protein [Chitinophagaceae bacterium]